jgi:hypothetical protein
MSDVAGQRNLGFINIYKAAGDAAFFNSSGFLDDGVHFSHAGGQYLGQFLFDAFVSDGRSLVKKNGGISPTSAFDPSLPAYQMYRDVPEPVGFTGVMLLCVAGLLRTRR